MRTHQIKIKNVLRLCALPLCWTLIIISSIMWNAHRQNDETFQVAVSVSNFAFEKDVVFRVWSAKHGGVYVPATEQTPPNPFLSHVQDRDIVTSSG